MTKEEAIKLLSQIMDTLLVSNSWLPSTDNPIKEAFGMAIDALNTSSSVQPKTGRWIKVPEFCGDDVSGFIDNHFSCSECKKEAEINPWGFYVLSDFCPNCGAKMYREDSE